MPRVIKMMGFIGLSIVLAAALGAGPTHAADVDGRISLITPDGEVFYGDWVRVFLTTKAIEVPEVDLTSVEIPIEKRARINSGHMDFYVNFRQVQDEPGYIVDNRLTRPDGSFAFHHLTSGRYYVLVTFPTMIAGFKCAWQVAVDVVEGQTAGVELDNRNLALPAY